MRKLLVEVDNKSIEAVRDLEKMGKIEKVSFLLNLFTVEGENLSILKIKNIKGVLSVEEEYHGNLMAI